MGFRTGLRVSARESEIVSENENGDECREKT